MANTKQKPKTYSKEILCNISIPPQLKTTPNTKLFIYIPNYENIQLSQGKNFQNGFWSLTQKDIKTTKFLLTPQISFFQFLLVYKNNSEEEIVSNIYYQNHQFFVGPFITTDFTIIQQDEINLRIKSLTLPKKTTFEIEGIPPKGKLLNATEEDGIWTVKSEPAKNLKLHLPPHLNLEKLNLTITGINKDTPHFKTNFNLVINLNKTTTPHKAKFKEIKIPTLKILKYSKLKFDKYLLSVKNVPDNCCVHKGVKVKDKWIIDPQTSKQITIQNFDLSNNEFTIILEYIIINKELPTMDNIYNKKILCNFKQRPIETKNYTKCVICKNYDKCDLFKHFMNYIGDSTILRHIIHK